MATGWDRGSVSAANYLGGDSGEDTDSILAQKCSLFFENFRIENQFIYRYASNLSMYFFKLLLVTN
jgi:hypothetical protein